MPFDPEHEKQRLAALYSYDLLDTVAEEAFDRITNIARTALDLPISLITLVDKDRQWFKSKQGTQVAETPRSYSFCSYAIEGNGPMIVEDLRKDQRFAKNPFVDSDPNLRFYCGVPLRTKDNFNLGTLCVLGLKPRRMNPDQMSILIDLARLAIDEIELRNIVDFDHVTGALMPRLICRAGDKCIAKAALTKKPVSVIVFEVDHFQNMLEVYGPEGYDGFLKAVIETCKSRFDPDIAFGRLSGDKFVVLLPGVASDVAYTMAKKIQSAFESLSYLHDNQTIKGTCALGFATYEGGPEKFAALCARAEVALHQARHERQQLAASGADGSVTYTFNKVT